MRKFREGLMSKITDLLNNEILGCMEIPLPRISISISPHNTACFAMTMNVKGISMHD
jgi:hypothetical protein